MRITWVRKPIRGDGDPPPQRLREAEQPRLSSASSWPTGADINVRLENGESGRGPLHDDRLDAVSAGRPGLRCAADEAAARTEGRSADSPTPTTASPLLAAAGVGALGDGDEAAGTEEEAIEAVRLLLGAGRRRECRGQQRRNRHARRGLSKPLPSWCSFWPSTSADIKVWNRKNKFGWTPLMIAQGHRPGNFRPAPDTIAAIERVMRAAGVEPPKATRVTPRRGY